MWLATKRLVEPIPAVDKFKIVWPEIEKQNEDIHLKRVQEANTNGDLTQETHLRLLDLVDDPASEVEAAINDAQQILVASGVTKEEAQMVANDLKAIAAEVQKNAQATQQKLSGVAAPAPASAAPASPASRPKLPRAR